MNLPLRSLLLVAVLFASGGCQTVPNPNGFFSPRYYCVVVTDYRGHLVAEYISRGRPARSEYGYRFRAVERNTAPPFAQHIHYPEGRLLEATGPNITVTRCGMPLWLYHSVIADK